MHDEIDRCIVVHDNMIFGIAYEQNLPYESYNSAPEPLALYPLLTNQR